MTFTPPCRPLARLPLLLFLLFLLAGCAAPSISLDVLEPAAANDVAMMRRLAVARFRNDGGGVATAAVEHALGAVLVGRGQHFTLIDVQLLQDDLEGQTLDLGRAGRAALRAGAQGVVLGTVLHSGWRDEFTSEKRTVCVARDDKGSCQKMSSRPVRCVLRSGTFSFLPKVVRAGSGEIVYSTEIAEVEESRACYGSESEELAPGRALVDAAREQAIRRFVEQVAPHFVRVRIPLLTEDDSAMPEAVKARVAQGVESATAGRIDKACAQWRGAAQAHPRGYALPYLIGVCAEYSMDFPAALEQYRLADQRCAKPVPEISEGLSRVRRAQDNQRKLSQQLQ